LNDDKTAINVEYEDIENEIYISAPQLAQKINDTDIRVRSWAESNVFGDLIGTEKVNGRKRYKESEIYKFAFVKELCDKNFTHKQIRIYISKNGFKYAEYDGGLVDTKDPLGFQALASALSLEVSAKLHEFSKELLTSVANQLSEHLTIQQRMNIETKAELESAVDEIMNEKITIIEAKQKEQLQSQMEEFKSYIDNKEEEAKFRDVEQLDKLKQSMENKKLVQAESNKSKSLWSRIIGK